MARKDYLKLALVIALTLAAGTSYGATQLTSAVQIGGGSFAPSNNVTIGFTSSTTAYSANSKHFQGDRVIATVNTDPKMYFSSHSTMPGVTVAAPAASDTYSGLSAGGDWRSL